MRKCASLLLCLPLFEAAANAQAALRWGADPVAAYRDFVRQAD